MLRYGTLAQRYSGVEIAGDHLRADIVAGQRALPRRLGRWGHVRENADDSATLQRLREHWEVVLDGARHALFHVRQPAPVTVGPGRVLADFRHQKVLAFAQGEHVVHVRIPAPETGGAERAGRL
jgi:hypothetical protein